LSARSVRAAAVSRPIRVIGSTKEPKINCDPERGGSRRRAELTGLDVQSRLPLRGDLVHQQVDSTRRDLTSIRPLFFASRLDRMRCFSPSWFLTKQHRNSSGSTCVPWSSRPLDGAVC
jgi:hypothetical protein